MLHLCAKLESNRTIIHGDITFYKFGGNKSIVNEYSLGVNLVIDNAWYLRGVSTLIYNLKEIRWIRFELRVFTSSGSTGGRMPCQQQPMYSERECDFGARSECFGGMPWCLCNSIRSALPMYSERVVNTPKTFGARCESFETVGTAYGRRRGRGGHAKTIISPNRTKDIRGAGWGGVPNSIFNKKFGAYSWFGKWNITIRERPFDFQGGGGGGGFGQAGIFFLHVFRDKFFFSAP